MTRSVQVDNKGLNYEDVLSMAAKGDIEYHFLRSTHSLEMFCWKLKPQPIHSLQRGNHE